MGHAKRGGRKKKTPNAISPRARTAIAAAAKRVPRGTTLNRHHWQRVIEKNPLINEARERQGQSTLTGAPRVRSHKFDMKAFCKDLSAVAMRAIQTDQFVDRDLVECLTLSRRSKLIAPDFDRLARTPWPIASLASSGIKPFNSVFTRSWSKKAGRVLRNKPANSALEFDALMSTIRTAAIRGFGGSTPKRRGGSPLSTQPQALTIRIRKFN
jgi:hypothetical protein